MRDPYLIDHTVPIVPTFYVNSAGHFVIRYAVVSCNSKGDGRRQTWEITLSNAVSVRVEELKREPIEEGT